MDELTGTDPRGNAPACPRDRCRATAGDLWCYTATGFRRHWHAARRLLAAGQNPPAAAADGSRTGQRPSEAQQRILTQAVAGGGLYEVSGYTFAGDAQRRAAMTAMAGPACGWFRHVQETPHGDVYEITDAGRRAYYRYQDWMNGGGR